ncbi:MAG TPA: hypothetical protein VGF88_22665 [Acidobacteriaceae bacterium]|jgi:hypothetical protein
MTAESTGTEETISFEQDVKKLFRSSDRDAMKGAFDLWSWDDVKKFAAPILERIEDGTMPCDGAWPPGQVAIFKRWVAAGMPQ